ncbi:MAG: MtrB/PioB family outer membrane beta-barrel protein, partial [Burkholderiaceae bacterium]
ERARLGVGYNPDAAISLQARLDLNRDRFLNSPYGVIDASSGAAGADLGYVFSDDFNGTLFYGFEDQRTRERSRQIASPNPAVLTTSAADWENRFSDKTHSIGVGLRYKGFMGGRLELDFDAVAVRGRTPVNTTVGPAVTAAWNPATAIPDLVTRTDTVTIAARYALDRHSALRVNYFYRRVNSQDWAYQEVGPATIASLIGTNEAPARYAVRGVGVSYVVVFR